MLRLMLCLCAATFPAAMPTIAQDVQPDQHQRFTYCILGNLIEENERPLNRGALASRCLAEFPHDLTNADVETILDDAIALVIDFETKAYLSGVEFGEQTIEGQW